MQKHDPKAYYEKGMEKFSCKNSETIVAFCENTLITYSDNYTSQMLRLYPKSEHQNYTLKQPIKIKTYDCQSMKLKSEHTVDHCVFPIQSLNVDKNGNFTAVNYYKKNRKSLIHNLDLYKILVTQDKAISQKIFEFPNVDAYSHNSKISGNGSYVALYGNYGNKVPFLIVNTKTKKAINCNINCNKVDRFAFTDNEKKLASAHEEEKKIQVWDTETGNLLSCFTLGNLNKKDIYYKIYFTPTNDNIMALCRKDYFISLFGYFLGQVIEIADTTTKKIQKIITKKSFVHDALSLPCIDKAKTLLAGLNHKKMEIYSLQTNKLIKTYQIKSDDSCYYPKSLQFIDNGNSILVIYNNRKIVKVDLTNVKKIPQKHEEALRHGCYICLEKNNMIQVCENIHFMCKTCRDTWYNSGRSEGKNCPECRQPIIFK